MTSRTKRLFLRDADLILQQHVGLAVRCEIKVLTCCEGDAKKTDMNKLRSELPFALTATVDCYDGNCSRCRRHSYVCAGGATNNWWNRSLYLGTNGIQGLCMDDNDTLYYRKYSK